MHIKLFPACSYQHLVGQVTRLEL